jgi:SAM-dependent methyltransferase
MSEDLNIEWWEKVLEDVPESYRDWFTREEKFLRKYITKGSKVLEVGCGEGRSLRYIIDITKNVVGIDNEEKAIFDAKNNLPELDFRVEDGRSLPFEEDSFDFVICMTTPANFGEDKQKFYSEMKRVLKKDGEIILSVFNEDANDERMKLYKKVNAPIRKIDGNKFYFNIKNACVSEGFNRTELEEIFSKADLEVIEIKKEGLGYFCRLRK